MTFDKRTCPYCGDEHCEADWVDVGVGFVQAGPFHCYACGATEIGSYDSSSPSETERNVGWYVPNSPNLPDTISTINGEFIDADTALAMYRRGAVDKVPFKLTATPAQFAALRGFELAKAA